MELNRNGFETISKATNVLRTDFEDKLISANSIITITPIINIICSQSHQQVKYSLPLPKVLEYKLIELYDLVKLFLKIGYRYAR